jgi:hypothetical protein
MDKLRRRASEDITVKWESSELGGDNKKLERPEPDSEQA